MDIILLIYGTYTLFQVVLILRYNKVLGIPDLVFALGDSAIMYFLWAINSMPTSIMVAVMHYLLRSLLHCNVLSLLCFVLKAARV